MAVPTAPPAVSTAPPRLALELVWENGTRLVGRSGANELPLDWDGREAFSPVQALALALAGCMASDIVTILQKGRLPLRALRVVLAAERAPAAPRRLLAVDLRFEVVGDVPADRMERAIALSRETYCSVWHSMRQDIAFTTSFEVRPDLA
ncbi:MAG TPA: OsmC family protein [Vicinamibacteria bacterium]|nr:OsmC family protein [Vicinamibacteria bacterium]